jgi:hypothetical protein
MHTGVSGGKEGWQQGQGQGQGQGQHMVAVTLALQATSDWTQPA